MGRRLFFDLETNGLLNELDRIHSIVLKDLETGEVFSCHDAYTDWKNPREGKGVTTLSIDAGVAMLEAADLLVGHNGLLFDRPALAKVFPKRVVKARIRDTLIMARLIRSDVKQTDGALMKKGKLPKQLFGRHSLKAWGYRLGEHKGEYDGGWASWSAAMQTYCEQDIEVTAKLYEQLAARGYSERAIDLEHDAALVCAQIEANGFPFDEAAAVALYGELAQLREDLKVALKALFPPWYVRAGEVVPKARHKLGYEKGCAYSRLKFVEFNPASRHHVARCLQAKYGWEPVEFTDGGDAKVDEKVLSALPYPEAQQLAELFLVSKRIAQLAEGSGKGEEPRAWLKVAKARQIGGKLVHFVFHRINPNGAGTGRATHSNFNIAQVPRVGSRFGAECRSLFAVSLIPGWVQIGADTAGLELRCLAHYLSRWDGGAYGRAVVEGREEDGTDVHTLNCIALGLEPKRVYAIGGKSVKGRDIAKTFIYAFLYGAGDAKLGSIIGKGAAAGKKLRASFLTKFPALKRLVDAVKDAAKRGFLKLLDGRLVAIKSAHSALNYLLQGCGAIVCKHWMVTVEQLLREDGLRHGWDGDYAIVAWVHDELQIAARDGVKERVVEACKRAVKITEEFFDFRVPLAVSAKTGANWKECH